MKKHIVTIVCICGWTIAQTLCAEPFEPEFSTWIHFEDKEGMRDSLLIGMDSTALFGFDAP